MKYWDPVNFILSELIQSWQQGALRRRVPEEAPAMRQIDTLRNRLREVTISTELFFPACLLQQDLRSISVMLLLFLPVPGVQLQRAPKAGICLSWSSPPRALPGLGGTSEEGTPGLEHVSRDVQCEFALFWKENKKDTASPQRWYLSFPWLSFFFLFKVFCLLSVGKLFEIMYSLRSQEPRVCVKK